MKKLRVSPALLALCAAVLLFVGAFFLGRASALGEARITVQRAAPASDALQIDGSGDGKLCWMWRASARRCSSSCAGS